MMNMKTAATTTRLGASSAKSEVLNREMIGTIYGHLSKHRGLSPTPDPLRVEP